LIETSSAVAARLIGTNLAKKRLHTTATENHTQGNGLLHCPIDLIPERCLDRHAQTKICLE